MLSYVSTCDFSYLVYSDIAQRDVLCSTKNSP